MIRLEIFVGSFIMFGIFFKLHDGKDVELLRNVFHDCEIKNKNTFVLFTCDF